MSGHHSADTSSTLDADRMMKGGDAEVIVFGDCCTRSLDDRKLYINMPVCRRACKST
jgi:hypothetical protein